MIQSEIAQNVASELKLRLISADTEQLEKGNTKDMLAFQEYLIGKHYLNQRTSESIQSSLQHFEKSITQDSAFALPYVNLAYAYTLIGVAGYGNIPRDTSVTKAKNAIMKALAIDETSAEAHAALGYIRFRIDWDWKGAEKEFKRAIELNPGYATAHEWYALFLAIHERLDESLKEILRAYELDPLSSSVNNGIARIHHFRGETDKALKQIKKTITLDSNYAEAYFTEGITYFKTQEYKKAILPLQKAINLSGRRPVMLGMLGSSYAKEGRTEEMQKILTELESAPVSNDKLYAISFIKSNMGQIDEALDIMEKLLADKYGILIYMKVEKYILPESNNPRFKKMLAKMGLD
jgi:serine/threonine-protein kinase